MPNVRINDLPVTSDMGNNDFVATDNGAQGTKKISYPNMASKVLDKLTTKTFSSLSTTQKNVPGAVNELKARVDNIAAPSGDPTLTELADIRVNFLGETFSTAGDAVRTSDMVASGFEELEYTSESVEDVKIAAINIERFVGGRIAFILNSAYSTLLPLNESGLIGLNNSATWTGAIQLDNDNSTSPTYPVSDYFYDYQEKVLSHATNTYRLLVSFSIREDIEYSYVGVIYVDAYSSDPKPDFMAYGGQATKTTAYFDTNNDGEVEIVYGSASDASRAIELVNQAIDSMEDSVEGVRSDLLEFVSDNNIEFAANEEGKYVNNSGTLSTSGAYRVSDYIEVPKYTTHVKIGNTFVLGTTTYHLTPALYFYDANKSPITYRTGSTADYAAYTVPSNAKYVRFNQPSATNANVSGTVTGFWFVLNDTRVDNIIGNADLNITFTSSSQVINSYYTVKAGQTYTITLSDAYSPSTRDVGRINIFSNGTGGSANYVKFYYDTAAIDFVCKVDGELSFYNVGGYIGTVKFKVASNLERVVDDCPIVYNVGSEQQYTSLTALLLALKDDKRPKVIIIDGGEYDIFSEYKALEAAGLVDEVPTSDYDPVQNFSPYNVFVPDNTHIIGRGIVKLNYMPDSTDTYENEAKARAPINTAGSMTLENVEIHCKNGRYCIHDEPLQDSKYTGAVKKYINVKCFKYAPDSSNLGTNHCFGGGIGSQMQYYFKNCIFDNKITAGASRTLYFHDRKTVGGVTLAKKYSSKIIVENCVIKNAEGVYAVFLGNISGDALQIEVDINNCFIGGAIVAADEGSPTTGNNQNSFDIRVLFSKYANLVVRYASNVYEPQVYSYS